MNSPGVLKLCQRLLVFLSITTTAYNYVANAQDFSYDNPAEWHVEYPQCGGQKQSPIAINTEKALKSVIPPITFSAYDALFSELIVLENTGYSIKFSVPLTVQGILPSISDGPLQDIYEAVEVHFHWGSPLSKGSEHRINQKRYDVEMHIVHKNTKYGSMSEAQGFEDGLSVIGVFFKVDKILDVFSSGPSTVFNTIPFVVLYNTTASAKPFISLGSLLENINREEFYTYQGSLTTPGCAEAVTWIVYPQPLPISILQLNNFWLVRDKQLGNLWNNFRPVQPIGSRNVYRRSDYSIPMPLFQKAL